MVDYGSDVTVKLASEILFKAYCDSHIGPHFLDRLRYSKKKKALAIEKKKNWFKNHKTRLVQRRGWGKIGTLDSEKRGEPLVGQEDIYLKLKREGFSDDSILTMCRKDFSFFSKFFFQHYIKHPDSLLHRWLYALYQREINKTHLGCKWAIAAPRANAKSSLTTLFLPLWCILFEKKHFIIIISDTASQAEDFLKEIKTELLGNKHIKRFFPHLAAKTDIWRLDEIITNNNVRIIALGSQSKILGRRHGAERPSLFLLDDLENQDSTASALMRERLEEWFTKEVLKAGSVDGKSDFFVIGTIKHEDSLLNNLIHSDKFASWSGKVFQAVISFADNEDLWGEWSEIYSNKDDENRFENARKFYEERKEKMLEGTKVLWPDGESYYALMEIKQESDVAFSSEKQNLPINRERCLIQPEEIRYYTDSDIENRDLIVFGALDPAVGKSKGKKGDYAAIVTGGKCVKSGKVFILDSWANKRSIEVQIKEIFKRHARFKYHRFGVESTAFQVILKDHIEKLSRYSQIYLPVEEIRHSSRQNKESRIEWMYPHLKSGTVFFHDSQKQLIEQVCNWTPDGRALHDDLVDCLSMMLRLALKRHFKVLTW